jgi:hypothetical protein
MLPIPLKVFLGMNKEVCSCVCRRIKREYDKRDGGVLMPTMSASISRRDLLLVLLGTPTQGDTTGEIGGITRLQKLLFLLEQEEHLKPAG